MRTPPAPSGTGGVFAGRLANIVPVVVYEVIERLIGSVLPRTEVASNSRATVVAVLFVSGGAKSENVHVQVNSDLSNIFQNRHAGRLATAVDQSKFQRLYRVCTRLSPRSETLFKARARECALSVLVLLAGELFQFNALVVCNPNHVCEHVLDGESVTPLCLSVVLPCCLVVVIPLDELDNVHVLCCDLGGGDGGHCGDFLFLLLSLSDTSY